MEKNTFLKWYIFRNWHHKVGEDKKSFNNRFSYSEIVSNQLRPASFTYILKNGPQMRSHWSRWWWFVKNIYYMKFYPNSFWLKNHASALQIRQPLFYTWNSYSILYNPWINKLELLFLKIADVWVCFFSQIF